MKHQTELTWSEAETLSAQETHRQTILQAEKLAEFLDSKCDMFSFADWEYYVEETGKSLDWLKANASYYDSDGAYGAMLQNAIQFGDSEMAELFI